MHSFFRLAVSVFAWGCLACSGSHGGQGGAKPGFPTGDAASEPGAKNDGGPMVPRDAGGADASIADGGASFGPFIVEWVGPSGGASFGHVVVRHQAEPKRVLWETRDDVPFLEAGRGEETVDSSRGSFVFKDQVQQTCTGQRVTSFMIQGQSATLKGKLQSCDLSFTLTFTNLDDRQLAVTLRTEPVTKDAINRIHLTYASAANEGVYGFGAQYPRGAQLNMKGKLLPIWSQEQGHGRGLEPMTTALRTFAGGAAGDWWTSYTAVPFYLTSTNRAFMLENSEYLEFDFREADRTTVHAFAGELRGRIFYGAKPLDLVEAFTRYSGRIKPLPAWSQRGPVVRVHGGSDAVRKAVENLAAHGTPTAGVWIEDWAGSRETTFGTRMWWNWDVDSALYPDWPELLKWLNAREIRPLIYFNPFITDASTKPNVKRVLFNEARDNGYLVQGKDGKPHLVESGGFSAGMIDLTSMPARAWLEGIMRTQLDLGVYGWMADFGEALPYDARVASGANPKEFHNRYVLEWGKFNREVMERAGRETDGVFFNRSGTAQSPGFSKLFWIGDQVVTWDDYDGFQTVIPALLSSGLSGYSLQHTDTGGWLSVSIPLSTYHRDQELLTRWFEVSEFTGFFRTHHTNQPADNHQYDSNEETFALFTRAAHVFAALAPYREKLMAEARDRGYPLLRHMLLQFPDDPRAWEPRQQMMLGSEFLVAPVVTPKATDVTLYLPAGEWVHLWTGRIYGQTSGGSELKIAAPIGKPAVFYRKGSVDGEALVAELKKRKVL